MSSRDFAAELKKEDALRQDALSPARRVTLRERIDASTSGPKRHRRAWWILAPAVAGLVCAVLAWVFFLPPRDLGPFRVVSSSGPLAAQVDKLSIIRIQRGDCTLLDEASGVTLSTTGAVALHKEAAGGIRVLKGRVHFSVEHRAPGRAPQVVLVSHGQIEVMGTQFVVTQEFAGGTVFLENGAIRFRSLEGVEQWVHPGETFSWPPPAPLSPPAPSVEPPPPPAVPHVAVHATPSRHPAPVVEPKDELLRRVDELRNRNDFEGAVHELKRGLTIEKSPAARERLSFELGAVLTHQVKDRVRACQQWSWHTAHFPGGRFAPEVSRAQTQLSCP